MVAAVIFEIEVDQVFWSALLNCATFDTRRNMCDGSAGVRSSLATREWRLGWRY
jgi:hypothetical protein